MTEAVAESIPDRLRFLLERQSCAALVAPAPDAAALRLMLQAAVRVPDHKRLRPYRFVIAEGEGLQRLGAIMERAAVAAGKPEEVVRRAPRMPLRAPMVITVVASPRPDPDVPAYDQELTAGCAVMALQMAAQALGYGAIWRSGWFMYDTLLQRELGLSQTERIVGFLYVGTPGRVLPPPPAAGDVDALVSRL
ncbi:putative NAD(P)H nitroreductase YdjA [Rhodovastum atsumiense]|uniref:Putative NAD(P)H nitroreductase n=1 Tax=Rhodovastum atsumiense TaxID=504468 RepID=A0A5M6J030_9PROT|nr:nitroreductase family protein [Rhodovastum atsumiense]KAA5613437.1 nitroreductase [Rhodovastum atsumiense]CAH2603169.1 putative NAD(P)H nitroreductase YdjA [Rhodovastum atsumiense]